MRHRHSRSRSRQRDFNAAEYWSRKPYCTVCGKRKVVSGTVCHQCRRKGLTIPTTSTTTPTTSTTTPTTSTTTPTTLLANSSPSPINSTSDKTSNAGCLVVWGIIAAIVLGVVWSSNSRSKGITPASNPGSGARARSGYAPTTGEEYVDGYQRRNGRYVAPHARTQPDGVFQNNWSTKGNVNPHTGKVGTRRHP